MHFMYLCVLLQAVASGSEGFRLPLGVLIAAPNIIHPLLSMQTAACQSAALLALALHAQAPHPSTLPNYSAGRAMALVCSRHLCFLRLEIHRWACSTSSIFSKGGGGAGPRSSVWPTHSEPEVLLSVEQQRGGSRHPIWAVSFKQGLLPPLCRGRWEQGSPNWVLLP